MLNTEKSNVFIKYDIANKSEIGIFRGNTFYNVSFIDLLSVLVIQAGELSYGFNTNLIHTDAFPYVDII